MQNVPDDLPFPESGLVATSAGSADEAGFDAISQEFLHYFKVLGKLQPGHDVLDVGCGVGRMARGLTRFLDADSQYRGFDLGKGEIEWCQENITPIRPNFRFAHADIANTTYNPNGAVKADEFQFPYDDGSFDFVFMASIFTHMFPPGLEQYMRETARVLRPGGRSLITYFLLNDDQRTAMRDGPNAATYDLPGDGEAGIYRVQNSDRPEDVIAFEEDYIRSVYKASGMVVEDPINFGSWSGRADPLSFQDIVVAQKPI